MKGTRDLESVIDDVHYWVTYEYGLDYKDGSHDPFAWVEVVDMHADGPTEDLPADVIENHKEALRQSCLQEASEALGVFY